MSYLIFLQQTQLLRRKLKKKEIEWQSIFISFLKQRTINHVFKMSCVLLLLMQIDFDSFSFI